MTWPLESDFIVIYNFMQLGVWPYSLSQVTQQMFFSCFTNEIFDISGRWQLPFCSRKKFPTAPRPR